MKKTLLFIACIVSSGLLLSSTGCGDIPAAKGAADDTPQKSAFNFIFKYGVTGRNTLDTFRGAFTKDMVMDPAITIDLTLTGEEMDGIYRKMVAIDFFSYPDEFTITVPPDELTGMVTPHSSYYFKVSCESGIKELKWEDKITNSDESAAKLKELINLIRSIIESKDAYKNLPEPGSGYL